MLVVSLLSFVTLTTCAHGQCKKCFIGNCISAPSGYTGCASDGDVCRIFGNFCNLSRNGDCQKVTAFAILDKPDFYESQTLPTDISKWSIPVAKIVRSITHDPDGAQVRGGEVNNPNRSKVTEFTFHYSLWEGGTILLARKGEPNKLTMQNHQWILYKDDLQIASGNY